MFVIIKEPALAFAFSLPDMQDNTERFIPLDAELRRYLWGGGGENEMPVQYIFLFLINLVAFGLISVIC